MSKKQKETEAQRVKRQRAERDRSNQGLDEYFSSFHGRFIVASTLNIGINIICDSDDTRYRDDMAQPDLEMLRTLRKTMLQGWPFNWSTITDWNLIEH